MRVKVVYLLTNYESKGYFEVNEGEFELGDIIVIEGELDNSRKYGVISKVNAEKNKSIKYKKLKLASKLDILLFWLDFENKLLHNKVKLSEKALDQYRQTKGNHYKEEDYLINKITRNMICSHKGNFVKVTERENLIFCYGNLRITYRNGTIYNVINHANYPSSFKINKEKKWYYSKILGVKP